MELARQEAEARRQEREFQAAERQRQLAASRAQAMLSIARGDPQRAYQIFGESFRQALSEGQGIDIPVQETRIPETRAVTITPRTQPPAGFVRLREPKEGEAPFGYDVTEQTVPARVERRLALPEPEVPAEIREALAQPVRLKGGRVVTLGALLRLVETVPRGEQLIRSLIEDPLDVARAELERLRLALQHDIERSRLEWQRYTDEQRLRLRELEAKSLDAYRRASLALQEGRLDLARQEASQLARYRQEMLDIQRERLEIQRQTAQRRTDQVANQLEVSVSRARADVAELREAIRQASASRSPFVRWGTQALRLDEARQLLAQKEGRLRDLEEQLRVRRLRNTVYQTPAGPKTSEEIIAGIRRMLARGWTRGAIARELAAAGIPPERFGLSTSEP